MSLQTAIADWRSTYDQTEINAYKPAYIGSIRDTSGGFHKGTDIYITGTNQIHNFNVYAGQGVDHLNPSNGGGKFVVESTAATGFAWNTVDTNGNGKYEFVTSGQLNKLSLGYTPAGDNGAAPGSLSTLSSFNTGEPLLVINGFNVAVNAVAASQFGVAHGNSAINVSATAADGTVLSSILANASLYESATLNSTVLYSLAFDNTGVQAFEWVLDKYLESKGSDITDSWAGIQNALSGTGVSISYYDYAPSSAVAADAYAVAAAEVDSNLLLAA